MRLFQMRMVLMAVAVLAAVLTAVPLAPARAQLLAPESTGVQLGEPLTQRWKVGVIVESGGSSCFGIFGTMPVPTDWPEQSVRIVSEDLSPEVSGIRYRELDNGVKQMLVAIPQLAPGATARALVTFEVTRHTLLPPEDPAQFEIPKRPPRDVRAFLGTSPKIETRNAKIRQTAREVVDGKEGAWEQVEAIYDWVRDNVEYTNGPLKGALAALNDGEGDCEELTSLFIALCRANRIPARTVWVPGHCYPEFYLEDSSGQGHWLPCQAAGTRSFGGIPEQRPILQKGDNFEVPEKDGPQRYVAEFLKMKAVRGAGQPNAKFVRELLPAE